MHKSKAYGGYTQNTKARKSYVIELQVLICLYVLGTASRASVIVVHGVSVTVGRIPIVSSANKSKDGSNECKFKNNYIFMVETPRCRTPNLYIFICRDTENT